MLQQLPSAPMGQGFMVSARSNATRSSSILGGFLQHLQRRRVYAF
jgi:hypothetical protein